MALATAAVKDRATAARAVAAVVALGHVAVTTEAEEEEAPVACGGKGTGNTNGVAARSDYAVGDTYVMGIAIAAGSIAVALTVVATVGGSIHTTRCSGRGRGRRHSASLEDSRLDLASS